jgi:4-amino-4-deoxy-L-arabinose transferase-like glycosyltransferase
MNSLKDWLGGVAERHGHKTLLLLAVILLVGCGLRAYRVVEPLPTPGDDAHAYYALSKALYTEGSFGGPSFQDPSDWSPGAPLLYAASFYATAGAHEGTARIVELLLGLATIIVVYLLGRRIACRSAGLLAAFAVAVYPPFIHSVGALYSEPPAMLTLPAAILAFLWASDSGPTGLARGSCRGGPPPRAQTPLRDASRRGGPPPPRHPRVRWLVPGLLFGATALIRPEYLLVGAAFAVLTMIRVARNSEWRQGIASAAILAAGLLVPVIPWTVHNQVTLHRTVPISTGGGKALYVGTFLPADGEYQRVKAILAERYLHRDLPPHSQALEEVDPTPLFDRVAERYPELPRDSALGKIGKRNFSHYFGEDPAGYVAMTARKTWRMWSAGIGEAMESTLGRVIQTLIVVLALAGLGVLAWRRWWWELIAMATPVVLVTAVGAISLAAPRRNEVLMTLVFPLAAAALSRGTAALLSSRQWRSTQASSPPN